MNRVPGVIALALPILAAVDFGVLLRVTSVGGQACDVYCGPGTLFLPTGLLGLLPLIWVAGVVLAVVVIRARQRAGLAWIGGILTVVEVLGFVVAIVVAAGRGAFH